MANTATRDTGDAASWRDVIGRDEIDALRTLDNWRGWLSVGLDWGLIFAASALVAVWPNPVSVLVALVLIGTRQLGLAVLMHEASHFTLFRNRRLNDWVGNWLCAYPIWSDTHPYRPYHLQHHARTGTPQDPDIGLVKPFPITPGSLRRKIWRDLSGQTGWKFAKAAAARSVGRYREDPIARRAAQGVVITNLVLLGLFTAAGYPLLYLLWVGAWFTTYTLVTRIRSIAEHALTPDAPEPYGRTRTTLASWWERLLIAPNRVNFHLEHHLLMTVPFYNLPRLHRLLAERGALDGTCAEDGYLNVLRRAASKREGDPEPTATESDPVPTPRMPPF